MILLDTNLLASMTSASHAHCAAARSATNKLISGGERLAMVPQNIYEFWAVATRGPGLPPTGQNGLGMKPDLANQWVRFFCRRFLLLVDRGELCDTWLELVARLRVKGYRSHDLRLAAAMQTYGISQILTFNGEDFKRFPVQVLDPRSV